MLRRVPLGSGSYRLGPDNATLAVHTGRAGAAAKAGHDLVMHVTAWEATLDVADDPADTTMELKRRLHLTCAFRRAPAGFKSWATRTWRTSTRRSTTRCSCAHDIEFRSTQVTEAAGGGLRVEGDLTLLGRTEPIAFDLVAGEDGTLSAEAVVHQPDWGMKPYSTLFGALKVHEDVRVVFEGQSR